MKNFKFYRFADLKRKTQQRIIIVSFLLFPVMLLIVFSYLPLTQLLLYSFTDWNGTSRNFQFVGFENYAKLWQDPEQFAVLKVSLYYIIGTLIQTALALYFSTILSFKVRFKNFFKAVIFFPYLINGVAIGFILVQSLDVCIPYSKLKCYRLLEDVISTTVNYSVNIFLLVLHTRYLDQCISSRIFASRKDRRST